MLELKSLEEVLVGLLEGAEFSIEALENIIENCKSEIENVNITNQSQYYIELVCKCYGHAMVALSKAE